MLLRADDGMLLDNAITARAVERWWRIQQKQFNSKRSRLALGDNDSDFNGHQRQGQRLPKQEYS
jgi:hypothetical protein